MRSLAAVIVGLVGSGVVWGSVTASASTSASTSTPASPGQNQTQFIARYEHNAQTEANLLQKAKSSSVSNATTTALSSTVSNLNLQITNLYTQEQALAQLASTTPEITAASLNLPGLLGQQSQLQAQLKTLEAQIQRDRQNKDKVQLQTDLHQHDVVHSQLQRVIATIDEINEFTGQTNPKSINAGLQSLQNSIDKLQNAAIYYTKLWIIAEASATPALT